MKKTLIFCPMPPNQYDLEKSNREHGRPIRQSRPRNATSPAPGLREWVPENHLSQFILDAVDEMDTSAAKVNHRGSGSEQYPPAMLLALLIYSYTSGVFSSRSIARLSQLAAKTDYFQGSEA
ncbi:MAG: hypothetical protein WC003_15560, partial [Terrimicrobiaceae bacterium]